MVASRELNECRGGRRAIETYDGALGESASVWWELVAFTVAEIGHRSGCFTAEVKSRGQLGDSVLDGEGTVKRTGKARIDCWQTWHCKT